MASTTSRAELVHFGRPAPSRTPSRRLRSAEGRDATWFVARTFRQQGASTRRGAATRVRVVTVRTRSGACSRDPMTAWAMTFSASSPSTVTSSVVVQSASARREQLPFGWRRSKRERKLVPGTLRLVSAMVTPKKTALKHRRETSRRSGGRGGPASSRSSLHAPRGPRRALRRATPIIAARGTSPERSSPSPRAGRSLGKDEERNSGSKSQSVRSRPEEPLSARSARSYRTMRAR